MHINGDATSSKKVPNIDNIHANASLANKDPFKFSHGLTGVDQSSNYLFVHILLATASALFLLALAYRILVVNQHRRRRALGSALHRFRSQHRHRYHAYWTSIKQSFLYAPSWTSQQDEEAPSTNTRSSERPLSQPQFLTIVIYVISNIAYCTAISSQSQPQKLAQIRGRCGTLASFNLIFTVLFALRNNPLIYILHISYDTFNLFHRWAARLVVLESVAHVGAFAFNAYNVAYEGHSGWASISWILQHSLSYRTGLAAFITFLLLVVHSVGSLRHASYDTFITLHRLGVLVAGFGLYFHLAQHALPQLSWVYVIAGLLTGEVIIRVCRILYYNWSWKHRFWTQVTLEALPGEATRATFVLPKSWNATPGSHVHVYLPTMSLWSSHPFSIAWSQSQQTGYTRLDSEKLPSSAQYFEVGTGASTVSCLIRAHKGMTRTLFERASDNTVTSLWGAIEGPYGGFHSLDSYDTVVLFAAGVGITHQLLFVRQLLAGRTSGTAATQQILLVWCIRGMEALAWVEHWLEELAEMEHFGNVVRIHVYVSRACPGTQPTPAYLDVRQARCDPTEVLNGEILAQDGVMAVTVCGPESFNSSVREAVRKSLCVRDIDFFEESFSY